MAHETVTHDLDKLVQDLEESFAEFWHNLSLLERHEWESPCLPGDISPKALVAHVAFWDDFQRRRMEAALTGAWAEAREWPAEDNDARFARDAARPWEEVAAEARANRAALVAFARSLTPEQVAAVYREGGKERPVLAILLPHMAGHAREHGQELRRYAGSLARWGREGFRRFYVQQFTALLDTIGGLDEATLTTVPVCGAWSAKEVLAHVLVWEEYALEVLRGWPEPDPARLVRWLGESGSLAQVDEINEALLAEWADRTLIDVLDGLATVHRRILREYDRIPAGALGQEGAFGWGERGDRVQFLYEFSLHHAEHAAHIAGLHAPDEVSAQG